MKINLLHICVLQFFLYLIYTQKCFLAFNKIRIIFKCSYPWTVVCKVSEIVMALQKYNTVTTNYLTFSRAYTQCKRSHNQWLFYYLLSFLFWLFFPWLVLCWHYFSDKFVVSIAASSYILKYTCMWNMKLMDIIHFDI